MERYPAQRLREHLVDQLHRHRPIMPRRKQPRSTRSAGTRKISGTHRSDQRSTLTEVRVPDPVSYTAPLPIGESAVAFLSGLLAGGRVERRTRRAAARWAATAMRCWCCAGSSTAPESPSSRSTTSSACPRPTAICPRRSMSSPPRHPSLHGALLGARIAGHTHVHLDGTLIRTDRSKASGTTCGRRGTSAAASSTAAHEERDVLGGGVVRCGGCGGSRARSVGARPAAGAVSGGRG